MSKGTHSGTPKNYMSVSFGKFRQKTLENGAKVDETTPGAVKRKTQAGADTYAIEYDYISGTIETVFYKDGGEFDGKKMQNTFEVVIVDGPDKDQISFKENDRFWFAFMKRLPNIIIDKPIKINVYDFDGKDGKRIVGLQVEQENNPNATKKEKKDKSVVYLVNSYYEKQDETGKWISLHGIPSGVDVNWKDEDDRNIHLVQVKKFLKAQFNELFADKFKNTQPIIDTPDSEIPGVDDMPF